MLLLLPLSATAVFSDAIPTTVGQRDRPIVIGIFPRRKPTTTFRMFKPLAKYISKNIHRRVDLETAKDLATFWKNVKAGRYDIVHYNQYQYIKSKKLYGYKVIARNKEFGHSMLRSAIVVRKDSKIQSLNDLKGKVINFSGDKKAFISYVLNVYLLKNSGVETKYYTSQFSKNPVIATYSVYHKDSDAAGVGSVVLNLNSVKKKIDTYQLRYLATSAKVPHLPWAVKKEMDPSLVKSIQALLVNLHNKDSGKQILKQAQIEQFIETHDADYDIVRTMIKTILQEDL